MMVKLISGARTLTLNILSEFTNIWETAYDVTTTTFDCAVNRTNGQPSTQMYLINHFLDTDVLGILIPDKPDAADTNGVSGTGSLGAQVTECAGEYGKNPNFLLVDVSRASMKWAFPHVVCT